MHFIKHILQHRKTQKCNNSAVITMNRLNHTALNKNRSLPEIFSEADINQIFQQIIKCRDYWKSKGYADWGRFFKMRDLSIIATIYLLGLRPNEACSLKFQDFNFRRMVVRIDGRHNKAKKDRIVPIPKTLMNIYHLYLQYPKARFWKGSKYLFPSFTSNHISPETLKTIMREKILKPLGFWKAPERGKVSRFRLYTLRHSRASHILAKQIENHGQPDIYAIANLLGHSDIRSTQIYLHTDEKYNEYLREQLDMWFL